MSGEADHIRNLKAEAAHFPELPGVYLMKSEKGEVIYVGKAKSLRARVRSYFSGSDERFQISFLLERVRSVENIVTDTEHHAFLLERDLITKYKPRYNIRLKDDKAYLSIRLDENAEWPKIELVRKRNKDGASYFGPYSFSYELRTLLKTIGRIVPLRTCSDAVFTNRQRPCLEYQIKKCCGPCCLPVEPEWYREQVGNAKKILEGKIDPLLEELKRLMEQASENLEFEDAASYRDRIKVLEKLRSGQQFVSAGEEDRDIFGLHQDGDLAVLSVLLFRRGRVVDSKNFSLSDVALPPSEIISAAISQYYTPGREIPPEVVLPIEPVDSEFVTDYLRQQRGGAVALKVPQRGIKFRLLGLADLNAKEHFLSKFEPNRRYFQLAEELKNSFGLSVAPRRIECVDISHTQGEEIVGALVCFFDGQPLRKGYQTFRLRESLDQDDYASIHEVIKRRIEKGREQGDLPDLFLIDGGKGQLQAALDARDETGIEIDVVSIAKQRVDKSRSSSLKQRKSPERIFVEGREAAVPLKLGTPLTRLMQRLRDEAHNTGIQRHRKLRSKKSTASVLDQVPGVGPERKRRLLSHFASLEVLAQAEVSEIAKVGRMSPRIAENILERLKE